ncbi:MAG: MmcQ/YjbR family DNA-binding protein [Clostridiales bacterium]|nr:MmcQ/YjbR family DNA-binding protein [Clostridiales bacterium]
MDRKALLEYAYDEFGAEPEYLWKRYPDFCVLRHGGNRKWFAVIMDVPAKSLGLDGEGKLPVLNVKCDPLLMGSLRKKPGFLPAYHMNKEQWLSVLLGGAVPESEIKALLKLSFDLTK